MNRRFLVYIGILIIIMLVVVMVFIQKPFESVPYTEVRALKSLNITSDMTNHLAILNNQELELKIASLEMMSNKYVFRLVLPKEVDYISGDFNLQNDDLLIKPSGQLGINLEGEYFSNLAESGIIRLNQTDYAFKVKANSKGKHNILVEVISEGRFIESKNVFFCSGETFEEAVQICLIQDSNQIDERGNVILPSERVD